MQPIKPKNWLVNYVHLYYNSNKSEQNVSLISELKYQKLQK